MLCKGADAKMKYLLCILIGYLIGCINPSYILSRMRGFDIRKQGSGNAGASNALIVMGKKVGFLCALFDIVKACIAIGITAFLFPDFSYAFVLTSAFCILGHIFPVYYKFKGGKGVVVAAISILCLNPVVFLILVVIFVSIVYVSKYISLGSIICAFFYPMILNAFNSDKGFIATTVSVLLAVIVIVMHKDNIKRLMARTENKIGQKAKK